MSEQEHSPKWKIGDEVSVDCIGRIIKIEIDKNVFTGHEKLLYTLEGANGVRIYNVNESIMYPLPTPEEVAQGK